jgi:hypothetical protein
VKAKQTSILVRRAVNVYFVMGLRRLCVFVWLAAFQFYGSLHVHHIMFVVLKDWGRSSVTAQ